jgi:antitoxin StbD
MEQIFASQSISVTELKRNPTDAIEKAGNNALAVLHHNRPTAYLVPAATYQHMHTQLQMQQWRADAKASLSDQRPAMAEETVFSEVEDAIQMVVKASTTASK